MTSPISFNPLAVTALPGSTASAGAADGLTSTAQAAFAGVLQQQLGQTLARTGTEATAFRADPLITRPSVTPAPMAARTSEPAPRTTSRSEETTTAAPRTTPAPTAAPAATRAPEATRTPATTRAPEVTRPPAGTEPPRTEASPHDDEPVREVTDRPSAETRSPSKGKTPGEDGSADETTSTTDTSASTTRRAEELAQLLAGIVPIGIPSPIPAPAPAESGTNTADGLLTTGSSDAALLATRWSLLAATASGRTASDMTSGTASTASTDTTALTSGQNAATVPADIMAQLTPVSAEEASTAAVADGLDLSTLRPSGIPATGTADLISGETTSSAMPSLPLAAGNTPVAMMAEDVAGTPASPTPASLATRGEPLSPAVLTVATADAAQPTTSENTTSVTDPALAGLMSSEGRTRLPTEPNPADGLPPPATSATAPEHTSPAPATVTSMPPAAQQSTPAHTAEMASTVVAEQAIRSTETANRNSDPQSAATTTTDAQGVAFAGQFQGGQTGGQTSSDSRRDAPRREMAGTLSASEGRVVRDEGLAGSISSGPATATQPTTPGTTPTFQQRLAEQTATPLPAARMDARVGEPGWADELAGKVVWSGNQDQGRAEVVLNPGHLGRIEISVSVSGDQATASFVAASPEARAALEQAMPRLREVLEQSGIQLGDASVRSDTPSGESGRDTPAQRQSERADGRRSERAEMAEPATPAPRPRRPDGNVDIFA